VPVAIAIHDDRSIQVILENRMSLPFKTTIDEGIAELVIDRPPVNALNDAGWHALADEIARLGYLPAVRVIVLRAEGRGFCAGVDIKELDAQPEKIISVNAGNYRSFEAVHRNPLPVIVAVHGFVLGGGIGLAGAADIVIAADDATSRRDGWRRTFAASVSGAESTHDVFHRRADHGGRGASSRRGRSDGAAQPAARYRDDDCEKDRVQEQSDDPARQGVPQRH
jgi:1,4-dihydroxy-2-naphthoyl-CoA synthase